MWKRVGPSCLYLARCHSPALYICCDPNSGCCFAFHAFCGAAAAAVAAAFPQLAAQAGTDTKLRSDPC